MADIAARQTQLYGSTAAWAANNRVLRAGEIGVEVVSGSDVRIKIGDGSATFSALPYASASSTTINAATQAALDLKLALAGGTLTGPLTLSGAPTASLHAATKAYADAINSALSTSIAGKLSTSGGSLTGPLTLSGAPTASLHAASKAYADAGDALKVSKAGDTMGGPLVLAGDPVNALEAASKQYVDGGSYQTVVGGSAAYGGKVVKLNAAGFLDSSIVPVSATYLGTINPTIAYALSGSYTVGNYYAVSVSGTVDASWNTHLNGSPASCGAGQFLIYNSNGKWDLVGDTSSSSAISGKLDKAGGVMTGFLTLSADPTSPLHAATKQYADGKLALSGGTLTGPLTLAADPVSALQPATKGYADAADALAALKANNLSDLSSPSTALTNLGGSTLGKSLFSIASAALARAAIGASAIGEALFTATSAAAARSAITAAVSGANTDITSVSLANTGLKMADTDASHTLSLVPGSNLTANRTLTLATGDANRTLDLSAANVTITVAGAALIDDADAAAQRATLGLGSLATLSSIGTTQIADNAVTGAKISMGSDAQGDILYYNGADYDRLPAGTAGQVLKTNGAGANPQWVDPPSGGGMTLLGTIATTSGTTQSLSGLNLAGYDRLILSVDGVYNAGSGNYILSDGTSDFVIAATSNRLHGDCHINLDNGYLFFPNLQSNITAYALSAASVLHGRTRYSRASTAVTLKSTTPFTAGSVSVYGVA